MERLRPASMTSPARARAFSTSTSKRSARPQGRRLLPDASLSGPAFGKSRSAAFGIAELLSAQGYATGIWGKWHLGSKEARFATNQGFDEWYGIPRSYDESMWPSLNNVQGMWPAVGGKQSWDEKLIPAEPIHEARRGEKPDRSER